MRIYCLDTSILLCKYGFTDSDRKLKANALFERFSKEKAHLILPAPALAEFLVGFKSAQAILRAEYELSKTFEIKSFDTKCAHEAAIIFLDEQKSKNIEAGLKQKVKVDIQIVAIAKSSNIDTFFSEDEKLLKLASRNQIKASKMPNLEPMQSSIFYE